MLFAISRFLELQMREQDVTPLHPPLSLLPRST
jgi:hypothetical protein